MADRDGFCDRLGSENLIVRETRKVILVTIRQAPPLPRALIRLRRERG